MSTKFTLTEVFQVVLMILALGFGIVMVGMAIRIIIDGFMPGLAIWVIPIVSAGLAITAGATGLTLLVKITIEAQRQPFEWTLPVLAIVSGLVVDTAKDLYETNSSIVRILYGGTVAALYLLGGILWKQKVVKIQYVSIRLIAILIFLTPPAMLFLKYRAKHSIGIAEIPSRIPNHIWGSLLLLVIIVFLVTILAWIFEGKPHPDDKKKKQLLQ